MTDTLVLWALAVVLACANTFVSFAIAKADLFERRQVLWQIALVWVLPVIGFVLVGLFLRNETRHTARPNASDDINTDEIGTLLDSPLTGHQPHD